jgi:N6-adenosine-specific RNA methylase IME4
MEYHEIANIFPMMTDAEFEQLKDDIVLNGQLDPVVLYEGKILDGRNRWKVCTELGLVINYDQYQGDNPLSFVISKNLHRRHLNETQRAVIGARIANMQLGDNQHKTGSANLQTHISQPEAAKQLNVSPRMIATVKEIERKAPEFIPRMERGEITANQAVTQIKKAEVIANLENIETIEAKQIEGVYDVIVIDPPWPMKKIERDVAPNQVEFDYPTMTEQELRNLEIPYADNAHVWLWTTHKFLPLALDLLEDWGLKYVCTFVWHKPGGFQPFGLPQYNAEFALYARRGTPEFIDTKSFNVCFTAPRGAHSEKPQEFYNVVNRVTAGRRLDMFNRRAIEGFDTWGNEAK